MLVKITKSGNKLHRVLKYTPTNSYFSGFGYVNAYLICGHIIGRIWCPDIKTKFRYCSKCNNNVWKGARKPSNGGGYGVVF